MEQTQTDAKTAEVCPSYLWIVIALGAFLVVMGWKEAPQLGILFGYLIASAVILTAYWRKSWLAGLMIVLAVGIIIGAFTIALRPQYVAANTSIKMNMHHIVRLLEEYYDTHGAYPATITEMLETEPSIKADWPVNPLFCKGIMPEPTRWLELLPANATRPLNEAYQHSWWPREGRGIAGNFIYLPDIRLADGEPTVQSYKLVGFGIPEHNTLVSRFLPGDGVVPVINLSSH